MEETLAYQEANGLLWSEVKAIMEMDSASIIDFITKCNKQYQESSLEEKQDLLKDAQRLTESVKAALNDETYINALNKNIIHIYSYNFQVHAYIIIKIIQNIL